MDTNSDQILTKLFDHIFSAGGCNPRHCGIDRHRNLVFGRQVEETENKRLMSVIREYSGLSELFDRHTVISPRDIAPFTAPSALSSVRSHRAARRAEFSKPLTEISTDGVKLVLYPEGLLGFAKKTNRQQQKYSLVSSVGVGNSLTSGIAKALADEAGDRYCQKSSGNLLTPGQCYTYACIGRAKLASSSLSLCQSIHNLHVPPSGGQNYHQTLVNTFVNLFEEAHYHGVRSLLSCFVGCGQGGGSGKELARAIHTARNEFFSNLGVKAPSLTLVGLQTPADRRIHDDFIAEWKVLNKPGAPIKSSVLSYTAPDPDIPSRKRTKVTVPTHTTVSPGGQQVLILGMLDLSMHPDGGMFGAARELAKRGEPFALVNAANAKMRHTGGIARQFSRDLGAKFDSYTRAHPIEPGHCLTVGPYDYAVNPKHGLLGCRNIHNVVAPRKGQAPYGTLFRKAFVNLLVNASNHGNKRIVSCFFGCAIFGGNGTALAEALHAAYLDKQVQSLAKVPRLSLVGWSHSKSDQQVHDDFVTTFKQLLSRSPLPPTRLADGIGFNEAVRTFVSETSETKPEPPAKSSAGASTATGDDKVITCSVCMESKPENDAQMVNDFPVCSDCTEDYQAGGVSIDRMNRLPEEFTAIRYEPLHISRSSKPLSGHPRSGRIIVVIEANAPEKLSNGQKVSIDYKKEIHYLPDNSVGRELLRLLRVLHEHQLIFKLDHSNTYRRFGITFSFHLKTRANGGVVNHGYPDPGYPQRALSEIAGIARTCNLEKELDVTRLIELIEKG